MQHLASLAGSLVTWLVAYLFNSYATSQIQHYLSRFYIYHVFFFLCNWILFLYYNTKILKRFAKFFYWHILIYLYRLLYIFTFFGYKPQKQPCHQRLSSNLTCQNNCYYQAHIKHYLLSHFHSKTFLTRRDHGHETTSHPSNIRGVIV